MSMSSGTVQRNERRPRRVLKLVEAGWRGSVPVTSRPVFCVEIQGSPGQVVRRPGSFGGDGDRCGPGVGDGEADGGLGRPAVVVLFERVVEEAQSGVGGVFAVVGAPFAVAVGVEPFLLRAGAAEGFERASGMQAVIGEAGADEDRDLYSVQRGSRCFVPPVAFGASDDFAAQCGADAGAAAGDGAPEDAEAVLADAAGAGGVAVEVGQAFPGTDGGQVRGPSGGHFVLADGKIGDTVQADAAGGPGSGAGPGDEFLVVGGFGVGEEFGGAFGGAPAAQVGVDDGVAVRGPEGGVGRFPAGPFGEAGGVRLWDETGLEGWAAFVSVAGGDVVLTVGMGGHDDRHSGWCVRAEDVDA